MNPDAQNPINQTKPARERHASFCEFIKVGKSLTVDEAIQKFIAFHKGATRDSVLAAFFNLNKFVETRGDTVVFDQARGSTYVDALSMRFYRDGKEEDPAHYDLVNKYTGQPMQHVH